jgi:hypothetical protein
VECGDSSVIGPPLPRQWRPGWLGEFRYKNDLDGVDPVGVVAVMHGLHRVAGAFSPAGMAVELRGAAFGE